MFKEIAPYVITATVIICILIAIKIKKKDILTTDGIFSVAGFALGLFITFLNLIYSNRYMISLGPLLAIACLLYLRFRDKILTNGTDFNLNFSSKTLKIINILYWLCISVAVISYYQAPSYYRPPIFFFCISFGVAMLGLEIISSKFNDNYTVFGMISKILFISLILRASAYFISPHIIGSDVWAHAGYIQNFLQFHHVMVPPDEGIYYCKYPLMHLYACAANLIGNISIKESMFIVGTVLTLSTIFVYLIVKKVTDNVNLALFSMLLLNFADFHIEWTIGPIAMTFGIAIYTILLYLLLKRNEKHWLFYVSFLILFLFVITWTHTVASYIALISVISLYVGSLIYHAIYGRRKYTELVGSLTLCLIFTVLLLFHWMDPDYPFFDSMTRGLVDALTQEAEFLGREASPSFAVAEHGERILNIIGFLIYIFFGIVGCLCCLSKKYADKTKVSFIFMLIILYFIFFIFPVLGLRNIVPYRWPAFIYVSFVLFVAIGLTGFLSILKSKKVKICFLLFVLFITSFFMITMYLVNTDSPMYGEEQRMLWTSSEVALFKNVNMSYNGVIVTDSLAKGAIFGSLIKRGKIRVYPVTLKRDMDWNRMNDTLVIWRKISLTRPVQVAAYKSRPNMLLGAEFKNSLDKNFCCIYDTEEAKAYLGRAQ